MKTKILMLPLAAVLLLGACKGSGSGYNTDQKVGNTDTARSSGADTSGASKLVKTADMRFKVKDVQQTVENIAALTTKYNGIVMHHQMQATTERSQDVHISNDSVMHITSFTRVADMTVSIPPNHLEDFIIQVARMGLYVNSSKMDIDDKSLEYLSSKLKQNNRAAFVAEQNTKNKDATTELTMKDDLVDSKINNLKIDKAVKLSSLTLSFYQNNGIVKEVVANDDPSAYQLPVHKRFLGALAYGWSLFAELVIGLANAWVFLMLGGASAWLFIRYYKRKHPVIPSTIKS